jgi:hypothetical protein
VWFQPQFWRPSSGGAGANFVDIASRSKAFATQRFGSGVLGAVTRRSFSGFEECRRAAGSDHTISQFAFPVMGESAERLDACMAPQVVMQWHRAMGAHPGD